LCSQKNLTHISEHGGNFITIVPRDRKEIKYFLKYLKGNEVTWLDAFCLESSRKKNGMNVYKTYEAKRTKEGFRIIFVHSSSKQKKDEGRRRKTIEKAIEKLEGLLPKLNAYHLKTQKEIKVDVDGICNGVKEFIEVQIVTERKQIKVKALPGRPSLNSAYKNKWEFTYGI